MLDVFLKKIGSWIMQVGYWDKVFFQQQKIPVQHMYKNVLLVCSYLKEYQVYI